jgi:nitroreductase
MKFDEIIRNRYSVREYQDKIVGEKLVNEILESCRVAPTAGCKNPVIVYVLNADQITKLKEATQYTFGANNIFLICYDNNISYKRTQDGTDFGIQDVAIITTHMMLKITELGLGSCWVGSFYPDKVSNIFNLPDNIIPGAILPFGYISENSKPTSRHFDRKNIYDFAKNLD